jgi:hypothetical protein
MSEASSPSPSVGRRPCVVQYESATSIGYQFRSGLVLTASKDEKLGEPKSVYIGDGNIRPARVLASRTGLGGRVSLLEVEGGNDGFSDSPAADKAGPERPVDFTGAIAFRPGGTTDGFFLSFQGANRRIDFVAPDGSELPVGAPVFVDDQLEFVGVAARTLSPPEQWIVTLIRFVEMFLDEERRKAIVRATDKLLGDQFLALARSLKMSVTQIWSLYELAETAEFKPYLQQVGADASASGVETKAEEDAAPIAPGVFEASTTRSSESAARQADTIVLGGSPRGLWVPLERAPRRFPVAPKAPAAWTIVILLLAIAAVFALFGGGL